MMDKAFRPRVSGLALWLLAGLLPVAAPATSMDLPEIRKAGTLRVLVMINEREPEFYCIKPGQPLGFDREILEGFAAANHVKVETVPIPSWAELIPALLAARGDVIAGRVTATEARSQKVNFTTEVFPTRHVAVTYKPYRRPVPTLEALKKERIGTVGGSSMVEALAAAQVPSANIDASFVSGSLVEALKSRKVPVVVWGIENAIMNQRRDPGLELGVFVGPPGKLAYGVRKDDPELLRALNAYIDAYKLSGQWSRLLIKYFGEAAPEVLRRARQE
jgi:ABC-type amino acid transport substrate-binding protein